MKLRARFLGTLFLVIACLSTKAEGPVFGNAPGDGTGFSIVTYNGLSMSGGAVEFTPTENIDLSSVSIWLSGYTGGTIEASIWSGNPAGTADENPGTAPLFPWAQAITLDAPTYDNGSLDELTFSDSLKDSTLSAGKDYWLVITSEGPSGNYIDGASWVAGGTPTGDAIFDGADSYNVYGGSFDTSSVLPAFSINSDDSGSFLAPVPEPSSMTLMSIPLLLGLGRLLYIRRKSHLQTLKLVRVKAPASFRKQ